MRKIRILSGLALSLALIVMPQAGATAATAPEPAKLTFAAVEGRSWGSTTLYRSTAEAYLVGDVTVSKAKIYVQRATPGAPWVTVRTYESSGSPMKVTVPATKGAHTSPFNQYFRLVDAATGTALTKNQTVRVYKHPRAQAGTWRYKSTNPVSRYNPCTVVTYRLDTRYARGSKGYAAERAHAVVREMSRWSGVPFKYLGSTTVTDSPTTSFSSGMVTIKYGNSSHAGTAASTSQTIAGTNALRLHTKTKIVLSQSTTNTRSQAYRDGVLRHELGHALGLGHSPTKTDLMYTQLYKYTPSSQDLAGLKAVGKDGGCL